MKLPKIYRNVCLVMAGMATLSWVVASCHSQIEMLTVLGAIFVVTALLIRMVSGRKRRVIENADKSEK